MNALTTNARRVRGSRQPSALIEEITAADGKAARLLRDDDRLGTPAPAFGQFVKPAVVGSDVRGGERVSEDGHTPAADEAVVPAVVVVETESEDVRPAARRQDAQGLLFHLRLDAAAAEGPALAAVGEDEHRGAGLLRRRAARLDHRAVDTRPGLFVRPGEFREE